jgi:hypothetical protein
MIDIGPVFLLFVVVISNYLAKALPCSTQHMLSTTTGKLVALYVVLLFGTMYASPGVAITEALKKSVAPYLVFVSLMFVDAHFFVLALSLIIAVFVVGKELDGKRVSPKREKALKTARIVLTPAVMTVLTVGVVMYTIRERRELGAGFTWSKFLALRCGKPMA